MGDLQLLRDIQDSFRRLEDATDLSSHVNADLVRTSLLAGQKIKKVKNRERPIVDCGSISVVIPLYGTSESIVRCLDAVSVSTNIEPHVIIIDNGAPSEIIEKCEQHHVVRNVIRNDCNMGYGGGCHQGIEESDTDEVVLLNSDAFVESRTLEFLVSTLRSDPDNAVVGACVVDNEGRLEEVGRFIAPDGHSFPYGQHDNTSDARFRHVRRTPYVSFVCVALSKSKYVAADGFDSEFFPAYYEDTDLCMRFHELGWNVLVDPSARVVHEGASSAQQVSEIEDIREVNRTKFVKKHAEHLEVLPTNIDFVTYPHEMELMMGSMEASHVLFVAQSVTQELADEIAKRTHNEACVLLCSAVDPAHLISLEMSSCQVNVHFSKTMHHWFRERIGLFDQVEFCDSDTALSLYTMVVTTQPYATLAYR